MFNGVQVKSLKSKKHLGLHIDNSLKFKIHIVQLRKDLTELKKNFILQKRAIKVVLNVHLHSRYDSVELFQQRATNTLPLQLLFERSSILLTHQILHDQIHHNIQL